jgi:predicted phage terminase large subunit-like protein
LQSQHGEQRFGIQLCPAKDDKVARALAAQPAFAQGLVFAPDKDWAQAVIDEMATFPKGKHDDYTAPDWHSMMEKR